MMASGGTRLSWAALPGEVSAGVEAVLGSTVVGAAPQAGGVSPGSADRVALADGRPALRPFRRRRGDAVLASPKERRGR